MWLFLMQLYHKTAVIGGKEQNIILVWIHSIDTVAWRNQARKLIPLFKFFYCRISFCCVAGQLLFGFFELRAMTYFFKRF